MRYSSALLVLIAGCGGPSVSVVSDLAATPLDAVSHPADLATAVSDASGDPSADGATACPRLPADADRVRKVVVSHPFGDGGKGVGFEVLDLSASGTLTRANVTFTMGTANDRPIHFTADGAIGLVAQDDGSLGVFRFDESGKPVVVHAAFQMGFYAEDVVVAPDGRRAFVLDSDTAKNGGGVYEVAIACDGRLSSRGLVVPGDNPQAMAFLDGASGRAILAARSALASPMGDDTHLIDLAAAPALVASGSAFADGMAIASSVATTIDGKFALISDNGLGVGSRVAVVALPSLKSVQILLTPNPAAVVTSPFGDAALVLNSDGKDALRLFKYDAGNGGAPFALVGEVAYQNGKPQLPSAAVVIARGLLKGRVLVAENLAVRQLQFHAGGTLSDVGLVSFGGGNSAIVGVVGVQP